MKRIEIGLREGLEPLRARAGVADVRVLGAIGVVQLDRPVDLPRATAAAVGAGVWLRPFRDLVYTMPPYVTTDDDLHLITRAHRPSRGGTDMTFGVRLHDAIATRGPLCVGLDPHAALLDKWGLPDNPDGLRSFVDTFVAALGDRVAVVKPQSAFFERHGSQGVAALESAIRQLRDSGALVLLDVKRGDIGSTVDAYADAYLDPASPLCADAITATPYLGVGSLASDVRDGRRDTATACSCWRSPPTRRARRCSAPSVPAAGPSRST